jgi:hypothetical protein
MSDSEKAKFFERLRRGLNDSAAYSQGKLDLRTTELSGAVAAGSAATQTLPIRNVGGHNSAAEGPDHRG